MRKILLTTVGVLAVTLGLARVAPAVCDSRTTTCLDALEVSGATVVGGALTVTGITTHVGAVSHTGVINTSAATPYSIKISSKTALVPTGTPTSAGLIAFDSTYVMYVSTGTGPAAWVKVGGQ